jgi:hypothetical protein
MSATTYEAFGLRGRTDTRRRFIIVRRVEASPGLPHEGIPARPARLAILARTDDLGRAHHRWGRLAGEGIEAAIVDLADIRHRRQAERGQHV